VGGARVDDVRVDSAPPQALSPLQAVSQAFDEESSEEPVDVSPQLPTNGSARANATAERDDCDVRGPDAGGNDEARSASPADITGDPADAGNGEPNEPGYDEGDEEYGTDESDAEYDDESEPGPSVVDRLALGASVAGRVAGQGCRHAARSAMVGMGWLVQRTRRRRSKGGSAVRAKSRPLRRTTAPPRSIPRNTVPGYVSNSRSTRQQEPPEPRVRLRVPLAAAALVGTAVLSSWLTRGGSDDVPEPPAPALSKPAALEPPSQLVPAEPASSGGEAVVPLFGPTRLKAKPAEEAQPAEQAASDSEGAGDLRFGQQKAKAREGSKVFARGRLHLPMVHKLKLDQQGQLLHGESTPTGFEVLIFDRKMMESGAAIARRDDRIAKVVTRNTPEGARVEFRFHSKIPAYKVRLKNGYVEFFINS